MVIICPAAWLWLAKLRCEWSLSAGLFRGGVVANLPLALRSGEIPISVIVRVAGARLSKEKSELETTKS